MAEKTATFGIRVQAESNVKTAADGVAELKEQLVSSQEAIKNYGASMRNLRGSSDEVKAAKEKLKGAIAAERDIVSKTALELGKLGKTTGEVTKRTKEAKLPVDELKKSYGELKAVLAGLGLTALAAGFVYLGAKIWDTVSGVARFVVESANLLRTQNLLREAATGSAENAAALGSQIDDLARRVPTARDDLQELSLEVSKTFIGTRISGQGIVDTFNAVAQASAAMGKSAGGVIENLISRGRNFGRFSLNPQELMGSGVGISFQDVAEALSKNLKIGVDKARQALFLGRVQIDAGAKAVRDAIENRFGKINLEQMKDLNVQWTKFKDNLVKLTSSVNLGPILDGFKRLGALFDETTVNGVALKAAVTAFGQILGLTFEKGVPTAEKFIKSITLQILKWEISMLKNKKTLLDFVSVGMAKIEAFGGTFIKFARIVFDSVGFVIKSIVKMHDIVASVVDGLTADLGGGDKNDDKKTFGGAGKAAAEDYDDNFKAAMQIYSPSKVFQEHGKNIAKGFSLGVDAGTAGAQASINALATPKVNFGAGAAVGGGSRTITIGGVSVQVTMTFPNVKDGAGAAQAVTEPSFRARLTQAIEESLLGVGVPIQTPPAAQP